MGSLIVGRTRGDPAERSQRCTAHVRTAAFKLRIAVFRGGRFFAFLKTALFYLALPFRRGDGRGHRLALQNRRAAARNVP